MHKKTFKFLQSVVVFPVMAATMAASPVAGIVPMSPTAAVISPATNRPLTSENAVNQQTIDVEAAKVDAYLAKFDLPLAGKGHELVQAAVENDLPPYSIAAIAFVESTAGKHACPNDPNNVFGWNSCHGAKFSSMNEAITTVASTLGGNKPETARFYKGKTLDQVFVVYNGAANPSYLKNMNWVMSQIEKQPTDLSATSV